MTTRKQTLLMIALALLGGAGFTSGARAALAETSAPTIHVKFADLDLAHRSGAEVLYRRIHRAAGIVCQPSGGLAAQFTTIQYGKCVDAAVAKAVRTVNRETLTAIYAERGRTRTVRLADARSQ